MGKSCESGENLAIYSNGEYAWDKSVERRPGESRIGFSDNLNKVKHESKALVATEVSSIASFFFLNLSHKAMGAPNYAQPSIIAPSA